MVAATPDILDCTVTAANDPRFVNSEALTPAGFAEIFVAALDTPIVHPANKSFTAGIWSAHGDAIVFVAPTSRTRHVLGHEPIDPTREQPVAISVNELWYYNTVNQSWHLITNDGSRPRFSSTDDRLFFLSGADLMEFNPRTLTLKPSELKTTATAEALLISQPMADGALFAPSTRPGHFARTADAPGALPPVPVDIGDRVLIPPRGGPLFIHYAARDDGDFPSVSFIYYADREPLPFMKRCHYSALEATWSPDGDIIVAPISGEPWTLRLLNVWTGTQRTIYLPKDTGRVSGLSFSPRRDFIVFSFRDGARARIGVVSTDGRYFQALATGIMPRWSPDSSRILYAVPRDDAPGLVWRMVEVDFK